MPFVEAVLQDADLLLHSLVVVMRSVDATILGYLLTDAEDVLARGLHPLSELLGQIHLRTQLGLEGLLLLLQLLNGLLSHLGLHLSARGGTSLVQLGLHLPVIARELLDRRPVLPVIARELLDRRPVLPDG